MHLCHLIIVFNMVCNCMGKKWVKVYLLGSVIDSLNPNLTFASVVISSYDCI